MDKLILQAVIKMLSRRMLAISIRTASPAGIEETAALVAIRNALLAH